MAKYVESFTESLKDLEVGEGVDVVSVMWALNKVVGNAQNIPALRSVFALIEANCFGNRIVVDAILKQLKKDTESKDLEAKEAKEGERVVIVSDPENSFVFEEILGECTRRVVLPLSKDIHPLRIEWFKEVVAHILKQFKDPETKDTEAKDPVDVLGRGLTGEDVKLGEIVVDQALYCVHSIINGEDDLDKEVDNYDKEVGPMWDLIGEGGFDKTSFYDAVIKRWKNMYFYDAVIKRWKKMQRESKAAVMPDGTDRFTVKEVLSALRRCTVRGIYFGKYPVYTDETVALVLELLKKEE